MSKLDAALIGEARARADLVALIGRAVALKRGHGGTLVGLCPFHAEKTPSFTVYPRGPRPHFHCYGCSVNGDVIGWVMKREGLRYGEAVRWLARDLGLLSSVARDGDGGAAGAVDRQRRLAEAEQRRQRDEARRRANEQRAAERTIGWCKAVWRECLAIPRTPAEQYLRGRGLTLEIPPSLRFHPGLRHRDLARPVPCMVAAVQDVHGNLVGLHRTYLGLYGGGWQKLREGTAKMMAGRCRHGHVRLCPAAPRLGVAEGIETALSVMQETGLGCWAAMTLGNLDAPLPDAVRALVQLCDADEKAPAQAEAVRRRACQAHRARGLAVTQARPPKGMDFNDLLRAGTREAA